MHLRKLKIMYQPQMHFNSTKLGSLTTADNEFFHSCVWLRWIFCNVIKFRLISKISTLSPPRKKTKGFDI